MKTEAYLFAHFWPGQESRLPELNAVEAAVTLQVEELERLSLQNGLVLLLKYVGEFNKAYLPSQGRPTLDEEIAALRKYEEDLKAEIERLRGVKV